MNQYMVRLYSLQLIVLLVVILVKLNRRIKDNLELSFIINMNLNDSEDYDDLSYTYSSNMSLQ